MAALTTPSLIVAALLAPTLAFGTLLCVLGGGGAQASPDTGCGPGGTAQTINGVALDAAQLANARTIVQVVADRHLPVRAATIAVTTAYAESNLVNATAETDHDSEGLFQQRISYYTKPVADDPVRSTNAFLDRLIGVPNWQTIPIGQAAQAVQISAPGAPFYTAHQALGAAIVARLWPTAAAAAPVATTAQASPADNPVTPGITPPPVVIAPVVCPGGDGAVPITGGHGSVVSGTTSIPAGLVLDGSAKGDAAAEFALAQLGKPYVFAAAGPDSFDCSGLTMAAWATQGVGLAHYAATQATEGTPEPSDLSQAVSGDLVLIPGADGTAAAPGHVGIVIGYTTATTSDGNPARDLWLAQAPGYRNLPVELTEARDWLTDGPVVAVRHIA